MGEKEYRTGQFKISPKWAPRPRHSSEDWQPRIVGYSVANELLIRTKQLGLGGKVVEVCSKAGANDIGSISFDLADPRTSRVEVIELATANARQDAKALSI